MDEAWPRLRDPEYGRRGDHLRARVAEYPDRPLVIVVGSSRGCMGVRPDAWEATRPGNPRDPLLFNMSVLGSGPIQELLTVRRVYADGFRPSVVLIEYWPPFLRQDGSFAEPNRVEPRRLYWSDRRVVRDHFPHPEAIERRMWSARLNPLAENGGRWLVQVAPEWLPVWGRLDTCWEGLDGWGWLPGHDLTPRDSAARQYLLQLATNQMGAWLVGPTIHAESDRALRELATVARGHGARVGFVFLPESSELRSWYSPQFEQAARAHLAALSRELEMPVIDARYWMDDGDFSDGFHLTQLGAAKFTTRFGPAVIAAFPQLREQP